MKEWTEDKIDELFIKKLTSLVYFYTPICGTCQVAGKMMTVVEGTLPNLEIVKANLNFLPEIASKFSIESVPCLLIVKNGVVQDKIYAFHSVPFLYEKIKSFC